MFFISYRLYRREIEQRREMTEVGDEGGCHLAGAVRTIVGTTTAILVYLYISWSDIDRLMRTRSLGVARRRLFCLEHGGGAFSCITMTLDVGDPRVVLHDARDGKLWHPIHG